MMIFGNPFAIIERYSQASAVRGMDYTPDVRKRIVLVPPSEIQAAWEQAYKSMCSSMIFGGKPTFKELLERMHELEKRFHNV